MRHCAVIARLTKPMLFSTARASTPESCAPVSAISDSPEYCGHPSFCISASFTASIRARFMGASMLYSTAILEISPFRKSISVGTLLAIKSCAILVKACSRPFNLRPTTIENSHDGESNKYGRNRNWKFSCREVPTGRIPAAANTSCTSLMHAARTTR